MRLAPTTLSLAIVLTVGCRSNNPPPASPHDAPLTDAPRSHNSAIATLADDVRNAPDAIAEGNALRQLQAYAAAHALTYTINSFRLTDGSKVVTPSAHTFGIRTELAFFKQERPIYEFSFVPKDNRNLAIIAADQ